MHLEIIELSGEQVEGIETMLLKYDNKHIKYQFSGSINIGITMNKKLIAGASACITAFKILYVSTVYVYADYRGHGIGRRLMQNLEEQAVRLGVNMIRLDTFDWQGAGFYKKLGYEQVGSYRNEKDGFSEYFFLKRL